jgi:hypothetical protein
MKDPLPHWCPNCRVLKGRGERVFRTEKDAIDWLISFSENRLAVYPCPSGYGWHIDDPALTESGKKLKAIRDAYEPSINNTLSKPKHSKAQTLPETCPTCRNTRIWLTGGRKHDGAMTFQNREEANEWVSESGDPFLSPEPCLNGYGWHIERLPKLTKPK